MNKDMKPKNPDLKRFECIRCGKCCQSYTQNLLAHHEDIIRWRSEGRQDILRYVRIHKKGEGKKQILFGEIWVDPKTRKEFQVCPFLKKRDIDLVCTIYKTRPQVCREYICRKWPK